MMQNGLNAGNMAQLLQQAQQAQQPAVGGAAVNNFDIAALIQQANQQAVIQQQALAANPAFAAALAANPAAALGVAAAAPERKEGKVKNWNDEKGFGFIDPIEGGENIFVHRSSLSDGLSLPAGGLVTYHLEFDAGKGKTRAKNVTGCLEGKGGGPGGMMGGIGEGKGAVAPSLGGPAPIPAPGGAVAGGDIRTGTTKSWFEDKGFGFVTLSTGEDCYVHRTNLSDGQSLDVGSPVTLTVEWDAQRSKFKCTTLLGAVSGKGAGVPGAVATEGLGKASFADFGADRASPYGV